MKTALLAEPVTLADETPVTTIEDTPGADGQAGSDRAFRPHVFTLRSEHLVWLGAGHTRGHGALDLFGLFERYTGTLVSDDYNGYAKYQAILTARQLCNAHYPDTAVMPIRRRLPLVTGVTGLAVSA